MIGSTMRPGPAIRPGHDIIRQTKLKVLQRHYETVVNELVELEKAVLTAPADQRDAMAAKLKALGDFAAKLEADVEKLDAHPAVVVAASAHHHRLAGGQVHPGELFRRAGDRRAGLQ